jgi:hypothetical protein
MWTGLRVPKERADALVELGTDDVFEFASLRVCFGILDGESVFEETLGKAMAANNVTRALSTPWCELHFAVLHGH